MGGIESFISIITNICKVSYRISFPPKKRPPSLPPTTLNYSSLSSSLNPTINNNYNNQNELIVVGNHQLPYNLLIYLLQLFDSSNQQQQQQQGQYNQNQNQYPPPQQQQQQYQPHQQPQYQNQNQHQNQQQHHQQQSYQQAATAIPHGGGYNAHEGPPTNQDMANADSPYYVNLRNQAINEGDLMGKAFSNSKIAYSSGDGARAKNLSTEGREHQRRKEDFNNQAMEWIFNENNKVQPNGSIDLHGLYVQESIVMTEKSIKNARQNGLTELRIIIGKGNHSANHIAKIGPAIEELMSKEDLTAYLDPKNSGVLVVALQGQGTGHGSREIVGQLEGAGAGEGGCLVM